MANHKDNPWNAIQVKDYEMHMGHPDVAQLQMLNRIMKEQMEVIPQAQRPVSEISILGITNGNGLEHIGPLHIGKVVGIDSNQAFLYVCRQRYGHLQNKLCLQCIDLVNEKVRAIGALKASSLIIANLIIEHIHLGNFIDIIGHLPKRNQIVSCVIQYNPDGALTSNSGFEHAFDNILPMIEEAHEQHITLALEQTGCRLLMKKIYELPNDKQFIRLDYCLLD